MMPQTAGNFQGFLRGRPHRSAGLEERMRYVLPTLIHLIPVVPFALGHVFAGIGAMLLVGMTYIKTQKLGAIIADLEARAVEPRSARFVKELQELYKARDRWRAMTFLRADPIAAPSSPP
jgi:hypothetical protein